MKVPLKEKLAKSNDFVIALFAIIASFSTYSCMYALRKPIAVATFGDLAFWGVDYKILLLTAQVVGYTLSKFAGIRIIAEMKGEKRASSILILILIALISLLFFALVPAPYNIIFLLLNGLPLGMIWGLVFSYLEGRRYTEVLGAGLSISFIFSSGLVKTVGKFVMDSLGFSEFWMPFITGSIFILPAAVFIWMLDQVPLPTALDVQHRTERKPMNKQERLAFVSYFGPGLFLLVILYVFLTAFRDFRDNFSAELWKELGYGESQSIFTLTEIPVSIGVLVIFSLVIFIRKNIQAFLVIHYIILFGVILVGVSTYAFQNSLISPSLWVILLGLGLYLGYVPFNSVLFDRLIAAFKYVSNAGFVMYIADAGGYLGSTAILLFKNFGYSHQTWLSFFINCSYILAIGGSFLTILSIVYFKLKYEGLSQRVTEDIKVLV